MALAVDSSLIRAGGNGLLSIPGSDPIGHDVRFWVDDRPYAYAIRNQLPAALSDFVDIAMAVYATDRAVPRRRRPGEPWSLGWQRALPLEVAVRDPGKWNRTDLRGLLDRALDYLTGDHWELQFRQRSETPRIAEAQGFLIPEGLERPVEVALFSGGLDSLAGLAWRLASEEARTLVVLSGFTHHRLRKIQRSLVLGLSQKTTTRLVQVMVPFRLCQGRRAYNGNERTQRTRGFVFGLLGAVAAIMAGVSEISIFENGVGALNLPYDDSQIGAHNSRGANPVFLEMLGALVSLAVDRSFGFRLPFAFCTKAETCDRLGRSAWAPLARSTVSCDGFPRRDRGPQHCGLCTSCLLRRQSLSGAGQAHVDTDYRWDVRDPSQQISQDKLVPFRAMVGQVETIRECLSGQSPWHELAERFPDLAEAAYALAGGSGELLAMDVRSKLVTMYARYVDEWDRFLSAD